MKRALRVTTHGRHLRPPGQSTPSSANPAVTFTKQISAEAYEYVYGVDNCHPCDSFRYNSPFTCEKTVGIPVSTIIGLSFSNTMALYAFLLALGPLLGKLKRFKYLDDKDETNANDTDLPTIQMGTPAPSHHEGIRGIIRESPPPESISEHSAHSEESIWPPISGFDMARYSSDERLKDVGAADEVERDRRRNPFL